MSVYVLVLELVLARAPHPVDKPSLSRVPSPSPPHTKTDTCASEPKRMAQFVVPIRQASIQETRTLRLISSRQETRTLRLVYADEPLPRAISVTVGKETETLGPAHPSGSEYDQHP